MSAQRKNTPPESSIPLGLVLISVGVILLLTVLTIWFLNPALMPRALYLAVEPHAANIPILPTRMALAQLPDVNERDQGAETAVRLPQSAAGEITYPDYFVSAADAAAQGPRPGTPTHIIIPALDVDAEVIPVSLERFEEEDSSYYQWDVPTAYQAGWHNTSARLGETGNTVINGHHNIHGEIFRDLVDLQEGDQIILRDAESSYSYRVTTKEILSERGEPLEVRLENSRWIAATEDERITLVTCWPYTGNSHRLVIVAMPVDS